MSSAVLGAGSWGKYGTNYLRSYAAPVASPVAHYKTYSSTNKKATEFGCSTHDQIKNGTTVLFQYTEDLVPFSCMQLWAQIPQSLATWNSSLQPTNPYWSGATLEIDAVPTKSNLERYIFPERWYAACAFELQQLLARQPSSSFFDQIAWCTHTSWCVYNMFLASNVYPLLWRTAVEYARKGADYLPPEDKWVTSFSDIAELPDPLPDMVATPVSHPFFEYLAFAAGDGGFGGIYAPSLTQTGNVWFAYLLGKQPWTGTNGNFPGSPTVLTNAEVTTARKLDPTDANGYALLVQRAAFFGGLDAVYASLEQSNRKAVVNYWTKLGKYVVSVDYWELVNGGTAAWQWLCFSEATGKTVVPNTDMIVLEKAYQEARKGAIKSLFIKFGMTVVKAWIDFVQENYYESFKAWKGYKGKSKADVAAVEKASGDNAGMTTCTMPPLFIRSLKDAKYSFDVMHNRTATVCRKSGGCDVFDSGPGIIVALEQAICRVENLLERVIYPSFRDAACTYPFAAKQYAAKAKAALLNTESHQLPAPPGVIAEAPKKWWPVGIAVAVTGVLGALLWKGNK